MTTEAQSNSLAEFQFRKDASELKNAPWGQPLASWQEHCANVVELPQGVSRHPVKFLKCHGHLIAVKEMPAGAAQKEYQLLEQIENLRLPAVTPAGYVQLFPKEVEPSYLITFYLERSIPYRNIFMNQASLHSRAKLLDAMAGLLVQLHLAGVFWGDCSLSNTLFRHDAGALQAYLVDAESMEIQAPPLPASLRYQDLQAMEENITAEMLELAQLGVELDSATIYETGQDLRQRYHALWEEITREEIIHPSEKYRIQDRIRSLNNLGYSIRDIALRTTESGDQLRIRFIVADRSFHRDQLFALVGLEAEEMQARTLLNEIMEVRAILSREQNTEIPIEEAAHFWYTHLFQEVIRKLEPLINARNKLSAQARSELTQDPIEMYCQVLEHKWYLSERARQDVGHMAAAEDYLRIMLDRHLHLPETHHKITGNDSSQHDE